MVRGEAEANRGTRLPYKFLIKSIIRTNKPQKIRLQGQVVCALLCVWKLKFNARQWKMLAQGNLRKSCQLTCLTHSPAQIALFNCPSRASASASDSSLSIVSFFSLINGKLVFLGSKAANPFGNPLPAPFTRFYLIFLLLLA